MDKNGLKLDAAPRRASRPPRANTTKKRANIRGGRWSAAVLININASRLPTNRTRKEAICYPIYFL